MTPLYSCTPLTAYIQLVNILLQIYFIF